MCRIFGYLGNKPYNETVLNRVSRLQYHGGPDQQDYVQHGCAAIGNNRLAVQGIEGGKQPFSLGDKIFAVLNGEIYNHRELSKVLTSKGYTFHDDCDGSIIPAMYREYGKDFARHLDGMFAIAILDLRNGHELTIVNDPAGIKSIYYHYDEVSQTLTFSSEIPALFGFENISCELRLESVDEYLTARTILGEKTIYQDIFTLPPASILSILPSQKPKIFQYETLIKVNFPYQDIGEASSSFHHAFDQEMKAIMDADVPICVLTSGGLDSSYITTLAKKYSCDLHSFNVSYQGNWPSDERHFAQEVAEGCKATYHQVDIAQADFPDIIQSMVKHLGQPNAAPHCLSTYALYEAVHKAGFKVAVVGEGADDFFGGYDRFAAAYNDQSNQWLDHYLDDLSAVRKSIRLALYKQEYKHYLYRQGFYSDFMVETILQQEKLKKNRLEGILAFEQKERLPYYILRRVDHLSMAHAVEVRVPFCQPKIMSIAAQIDNQLKVRDQDVKRIIYGAAYGKLPYSVLHRPKQPFTLPITAMIQKGNILFDFIYETLNAENFLLNNIFDKKIMDTLFDQQLVAPNKEAANTLWSIMILELWLKQSKSKFNLR